MPKSKRRNRQTQFKLLMSVIIFISSTGLYINCQQKQSNSPINLHKVSTNLQKKHDKRLFLSVDVKQVNLKKMHIKQLKFQMEVKKDEIEKSKEETHKQIKVTATAYVALCDTQCTGITKIGYDVRNTIYYHGYRVIAVDPSVIPLYSIVKVSYNDISFTAIAIDTGSAINNFHIDLLVHTKQQALEFGIRTVTLDVLREGKG